jgi:hypothetical protein
MSVSREIAPDGEIVLRAERGSFHFRRTAPGVLHIRIEGIDNGQFGTAALDEIAVALVRERPLELFIDASGASMPAVSVSREWTRFFSLNQKDLKRVSVLVSSKTVELTVAIAQHLSQTGKLIQIYSDSELFGTRKAAASSAR